MRTERYIEILKLAVDGMDLTEETRVEIVKKFEDKIEEVCAEEVEELMRFFNK